MKEKHKSQRSGSESSQSGDRPRQDDIVRNEEAAIRTWQSQQGFEAHPIHSIAINTPIPAGKDSSEDEDEEDDSEESEEEVGQIIEVEEKVCEGGQELFDGFDMKYQELLCEDDKMK